MAVETIGTASGGFFNFRGANATPYAMGSSVSIATTGGNINIAAGFEGIVCSQMTFQCSGYTTTSTLYGNIWNSSGNSVTASPGVSAASDTTAPFGSKTFNLSDQYFARQTIYVGYSRAAASPTAWDVVNGDNTTRVGNTAGSAPNGLTASGTGTIYRRLVGTLTYTPYDAGNISQSLSQPSNRVARVTFAGNSPTYGKNISVDWGDGTTSTATVAAGAVPAAITKPAAYSNSGLKTVTTTLSHASTSVGIPDIVLTSTITVFTFPNGVQSLTATPGNTSVLVDWVTPSSDGGDSIDRYEVYRFRWNGASWVESALIYSAGPTTTTATGLTNGQLYLFQVYAINGAPDGYSGAPSGYSIVREATATPRTVPSIPSVTATPGNASISITFSSSSNGGATIYYYEYSLDNVNWSGAISSPYNITGLTNGTSYTVRVRALNEAGYSGTGSAAATTPRTVPNAPQSLTVTPYTNEAYGSWNAPSFNGGSNVIRYEYSIDGTTWIDSSGLYTVGFNGLITGLNKYSSYTYYVRAVNIAGNSTAATASFTTFGGRYYVAGLASPYKYAQVYNGSTWSTAPVRVYNGTTWEYTEGNLVPDAPGSPIETGNNGVIGAPYEPYESYVEWSAPIDHGRPITEYKIEKSTDGLTSWSLYGTVASNTATISVPYLQEFYIRVSAYNVNGYGPTSTTFYLSNL